MCEISHVADDFDRGGLGFLFISGPNPEVGMVELSWSGRGAGG